MSTGNKKDGDKESSLAPRRRIDRRSSILKPSRPLDNPVTVDDREKKSVSFNQRILVKEFLKRKGKPKKPNDSSDSASDGSTSNVYEAQANESFFQISTPMGEKKRRLTGSSFVSADRLSIIPQVYNAELDDDELEFEPFIEESPGAGAIPNNKENNKAELHQQGPTVNPDQFLSGTINKSEDMSLTQVLTPVLVESSLGEEEGRKDSFTYINQQQPVSGSSLQATQQQQPVSGSSLQATQQQQPVSGSSLQATQQQQPVSGSSLQATQQQQPVSGSSFQATQQQQPVSGSSLQATQQQQPVSGSSLQATQQQQPVSGLSLQQQPVTEFQSSNEQSENSASLNIQPTYYDSPVIDHVGLAQMDTPSCMTPLRDISIVDDSPNLTHHDKSMIAPPSEHISTTYSVDMSMTYDDSNIFEVSVEHNAQSSIKNVPSPRSSVAAPNVHKHSIETHAPVSSSLVKVMEVAPVAPTVAPPVVPVVAPVVVAPVVVEEQGLCRSLPFPHNSSRVASNDCRSAGNIGNQLQWPPAPPHSSVIAPTGNKYSMEELAVSPSPVANTSIIHNIDQPARYPPTPPHLVSASTSVVASNVSVLNNSRHSEKQGHHQVPLPVSVAANDSVSLHTHSIKEWVQSLPTPDSFNTSAVATSQSFGQTNDSMSSIDHFPAPPPHSASVASLSRTIEKQVHAQPPLPSTYSSANISLVAKPNESSHNRSQHLVHSPPPPPPPSCPSNTCMSVVSPNVEVPSNTSYNETQSHCPLPPPTVAGHGESTGKGVCSVEEQVQLSLPSRSTSASLVAPTSLACTSSKSHKRPQATAVSSTSAFTDSIIRCSAGQKHSSINSSSVLAVSKKLALTPRTKPGLKPGLKSPFMPDYTGPNSYVQQLTNSLKKKPKKQQKQLPADPVQEQVMVNPVEPDPLSTPKQQKEISKSETPKQIQEHISVDPISSPQIKTRASDAQARTFTIYSAAAAAGIEDDEEEMEDEAMADRTFVISTSKTQLEDSLDLDKTVIVDKEQRQDVSEKTPPVIKGDWLTKDTPDSDLQLPLEDVTPLTPRYMTRSSKALPHPPSASKIPRPTPRKAKNQSTSTTPVKEKKGLSKRKNDDPLPSKLTPSAKTIKLSSPQKPPSTRKITEMTPSKLRLKRIVAGIAALKEKTPPREVDSPVIRTPEIMILDDTGLNQTAASYVSDTGDEFEASTGKEVLKRMVMAADANKTVNLYEEYEEQEKERKRLVEEKRRQEELARLEEEKKREEQKRREEEEKRRQEELARLEEERKREEQKRQEEEEKRRQEELARLEEERKREEQKRKDEEEKRRQEELVRLEEERKREEQKRREEEEKRRQEELARLEEERKREEQKRQEEEEKRRQEELARLEEERKREEQKRREEEEKKRQEELARLEEERKREEQKQKDEEEQRRQEELARLEEERKREEQKRQEEEEQRRQEELARLEEERKRMEELERLEQEQKRTEALELERKRKEEERKRIEALELERKRQQELEQIEEERKQKEAQKLKEEEMRLQVELKLQNMRLEEERKRQAELELLKRDQEEERMKLEKMEMQRKREEEEKKRQASLDERIEMERQRQKEERRKQEELEEDKIRQNLVANEPMEVVERGKDVSVQDMANLSTRPSLSLIDCLERLHKELKLIFDSIASRLNEQYSRHRPTLLHLHGVAYGSVCAARCMIDYARLSDLESPDCDIDMSSATAPSLPAHDNDKSGSVEEKEDWIDQLLAVMDYYINNLMKKKITVKFAQHYLWDVKKWSKELVVIILKKEIILKLELDTERVGTQAIACQKITSLSFTSEKDGVMVDHLNNHIFKHKSIILEIPMLIQELWQSI